MYIYSGSMRAEALREGQQRRPAEDEALVRHERGGCEERADPTAEAAPAEAKQP
jgi:hypothetical protein